MVRASFLSFIHTYIDHCINGKFVPLGWKATDPVPAGQAVLATLVARCYRMIHSSYGGLTVDTALKPIQIELHLINDQLKFLVCDYSQFTLIDSAKTTSCMT
jgi:hypothetical protein